ncbi:rho guanine nucleotide exchange factor 19 [Fundulus heteroclitus]|uniref:rho guanine nucleotide exchange factor 19 n=1 Tax=Fundulus heteroclitus TaxID=8078 RepID=UPI00165A739F|nr:rho guanine nucleotide exchange factor 19 [Fundulus heteroclitus]
MTSFNGTPDRTYGFKWEVTGNLEPSDLFPVGFSNLKINLNGSGGTTDPPEDYSPCLDLSSALKVTPLEQTWHLQSPSVGLRPFPEPQEDEPSSPQVDSLEEGEESLDEELSSVTFMSKYINDFPLYQDYSLQTVRDEIQKLKDWFVADSDLVKCEPFRGRLFQRPKVHLEVASPYLTPDSTSSSPTNFHGRRSAVRRHSHSGVVAAPRSPSPSNEPSVQERASSLRVDRHSEFKAEIQTLSAPSPNPPPNIRLTSYTLWQDLDEVKASGLLNMLTPKEISLQESLFELIGSEVSYLKSLGVVVNHFYASKELKKTISKLEHHTLFHNIRHVMEANTKFYLDLEARLAESLIIYQVGDIVLQHCGNFQRHYVPYVTNMTYQESLVNQLLQQNKDFVYALKKLESDPVCQKRRLKSFLVLPFQRITRIKLLMESILKATEPNSEAASNLKKAIKGIHEIVFECDQKVEKMKRLEELVRLEPLMDFGDIKSVPLVKSTRFLIHHGALATVETYYSKLSITRIYLHLFNDLLIISSKKYQRFTVLDYALFPEHVTVLQNKVLGLPSESFLLNLSESQIGPPTAMILIADDSFNKEEWIKALSKK